MATHKVPQNVEADDKLLGPLSLKQFIFVVIGLGFGYLTFVFFQRVHPLAAVIWLPFTLFFLVLGGYQRKDQPAEVFLMSALRFYLKPRKRKWDQEGYEERVKITAPPKIEHHYTKSFTGEEAVGRLANLSLMMDSRGWASKVATDWQNPQLATVAASDSDRLVTAQDVASVQAFDPQHYVTAVDVMDEQSSIVSQQFDTRIQRTDANAMQQAIQTLQQAQQDEKSGVSAGQTSPDPQYQRYPAMQQKIVQPTESASAPSEDTSSTNQQVPTNDTTSAPPTLDTPEIEADEGVEISLH